jgi:hypothetical protein
MTKTATVHAQQKWEYMELTRKTETYLVHDLNEEGQHGWELVTVIQGKDRHGEAAWTAFLKRPYAGHGAPQQASADTLAREQAQRVRALDPKAASAPDEEEFHFKDE